MNKTVCRLCGNNEGTSYIFSPSEEINKKITYCCSDRIPIAKGDGLPAYICVSCSEDLDRTYIFLRKCEWTDQRLRSVKIHGSVRQESSSNHQLKQYELKVEVKEDVEFACTSYCENHIEDVLDVQLPLIQENNGKLDISESKIHQKSNKKRKSNNKCSVCGQLSSSASALIVHMRNHTGERPFKCPNCNKQYKDNGNLKSHIKKHHSADRKRNFICEHCGKDFFTKNDVKIHMRIHTGETPYECMECSMKFTQIGALTRHKKTHTGDKPHVCSTCSKNFSTKERLKCHSKAHSDQKNYSCTICNTLFKYQNNLRKHMVLHSAPNSYVCNHCGRRFNQKGNLKLHIDRKHSEKSGYCNICCKHMSDIEVHMWRHTGQRPLKCEFCASSFFEMKTLARHINYRHKNPDKFKCSYEGCNKTFPAKPMLQFHTAKFHETGIPFPCDRCARGFYRKNDLARHKIGTHKEKLCVV